MILFTPVSYCYKYNNMRNKDQILLESLYSSIFLNESLDEEYFRLAQNPEENKEALQKMVDEAVKKAVPKNSVILYRGLEKVFNKTYDYSKMDSMIGYSTWTDTLLLARQYAGPNGYVYAIFIPKSDIKAEYINNDGDRAFVYTGKKAGLNNVNGKEYLVYEYHEMFSPNKIKSLDPVTYDDGGNIIPISQRFDSSKDDIRY